MLSAVPISELLFGAALGVVLAFLTLLFKIAGVIKARWFVCLGIIVALLLVSATLVRIAHQISSAI